MFQLFVRIARELHMPIRAVMGLPAGEIDTWSAVYQEEYYQEQPSERAKDKIDDRETYGYSKKSKRLI